MIREQIIEILAYWKESQKNLRSRQKIAKERNETYRRKHNVNKNEPLYLINKVTVQHKKDRIVRLITEDLPETLAQILNLDKSDVSRIPTLVVNYTWRFGSWAYPSGAPFFNTNRYLMGYHSR